MKPDGSSYLGEGGRCGKGDTDEFSLLDLTAGFGFGRRFEPSSSSTNAAVTKPNLCGSRLAAVAAGFGGYPRRHQPRAGSRANDRAYHRR